MEGYLEIALEEYDFSKGYDETEIERCIRFLGEYLADVWGVSDDESEPEEIPDDLFGDEGLDCDDIQTIQDECRDLMKIMLERETPIIHIHCETVPDFTTTHIQSTPISRVEPTEEEINESLRAIDCFRGKNQQRTPEWHSKRKQMITASISHKILKMDLQSGKGIGVLREKITETTPVTTPTTVEDDDYIEWDLGGMGSGGMSVIPSNPDAPNVRGQRYEPIIRKMYEKQNSVEVEEYDCVSHPALPFLGASPDGIVTSNGPLRGRMVEIKCPNPASVLKDGNQIREEYWTQMQIQMEVCNLPKCDYVRVAVRDSPTIVGIQDVIRSRLNELRGTFTFDPTAPLIAESGTIWMRNDGEYIEESSGKFIHENAVLLKYGRSVAFIRHYVIFHQDVYIRTVSRDSEWFNHRFLPKLMDAWGEIQRGLVNPAEWNAKHSIRRKGGNPDSPVPPPPNPAVG